MKTIQAFALFTLILLATTTATLCITAASNLPYQSNPAMTDYPTVLTENLDGFIDTGACSKEALSTSKPVVRQNRSYRASLARGQSPSEPF